MDTESVPRSTRELTPDYNDAIQRANDALDYLT
jgi:hypothetical protein